MISDVSGQNARMGPCAPLVSVLIPCFNGEPWVKQCIQSALDQDYPNTEVIVADDGSSDASVDVIRSFGNAVSFHQLPHRGGNVARNQLMTFAQGEWLQYLDADDFLLPNKISAQVAAATRHSVQPDVVYSPVIIHDVSSPGSDYVFEIGAEDPTVTFIRWGSLNTNGLLLRKRSLTRVGGWREDQPCCQEHELLLRLLKAGARFLLHREAGAVYRTHGAHTVSRKNPLQVIQVRMEITDWLVEYLAAEGLLTRAHDEALYAARMESARGAWGLDPQYALCLAAKAKGQHRFWVRSSQALPLPYQVVLRVAGFRAAELVAASLRRVRSS